MNGTTRRAHRSNTRAALAVRVTMLGSQTPTQILRFGSGETHEIEEEEEPEINHSKEETETLRRNVDDIEKEIERLRPDKHIILPPLVFNEINDQTKRNSEYEKLYKKTSHYIMIATIYHNGIEKLKKAGFIDYHGSKTETEKKDDKTYVEQHGFDFEKLKRSMDECCNTLQKKIDEMNGKEEENKKLIENLTATVNKMSSSVQDTKDCVNEIKRMQNTSDNSSRGHRERGAENHSMPSQVSRRETSSVSRSSRDESNKAADFAKQITEKDLEIASLKESVENLQSKIKDLEVKLEQMNIIFEEQKQKEIKHSNDILRILAKHETEKIIHEKEIESYVNDMQLLKTQIQENEDAISKLEQEKDNLLQQYNLSSLTTNQENGSLKLVNSELVKKNDELKNLQAVMQKQINDLNDATKVILDENHRIQNEKKLLLQEIEKLNEEIKKKNKEYEVFIQKKLTENGVMKKLEQDISNNNKEIEQLKVQIQNLLKEKNELEIIIRNNDTDIKKYKQDLVLLQSDKEKLNTTKTECDNEKNILNKKIEDLGLQVVNLEFEMRNLTSQNENLKKKLTDTESEKKNNEDIYNKAKLDYETRIAELIKQLNDAMFQLETMQNAGIDLQNKFNNISQLLSVEIGSIKDQISPYVTNLSFLPFFNYNDLNIEGNSNHIHKIVISKYAHIVMAKYMNVLNDDNAAAKLTFSDILNPLIISISRLTDVINERGRSEPHIANVMQEIILNSVGFFYESIRKNASIFQYACYNTQKTNEESANVLNHHYITFMDSFQEIKNTYQNDIGKIINIAYENLLCLALYNSCEIYFDFNTSFRDAEQNLMDIINIESNQGFFRILREKMSILSTCMDQNQKIMILNDISVLLDQISSFINEKAVNSRENMLLCTKNEKMIIRTINNRVRQFIHNHNQVFSNFETLNNLNLHIYMHFVTQLTALQNCIIQVSGTQDEEMQRMIQQLNDMLKGQTFFSNSFSSVLCTNTPDQIPKFLVETRENFKRIKDVYEEEGVAIFQYKRQVDNVLEDAYGFSNHIGAKIEPPPSPPPPPQKLSPLPMQLPPPPPQQQQQQQQLLPPLSARVLRQAQRLRNVDHTPL